MHSLAYVISETDIAPEIDGVIEKSKLEHDYYIFGGNWSGAFAGKNCVTGQMLSSLIKDNGLNITIPEIVILPDGQVEAGEKFMSVLEKHHRHFIVVVDIKH